MKILLTGTHFTTAVATIEELKKFQDINLVYIGRLSTREGDASPSVESTELPKLGVRFVSITTGRLQRSFTLYTIPSLLKIPIGFTQAFFILLKERPDVVLSFGGYVGLPLVFWAWLFSIPIIVHEQTLVSGLANKISGLFADKIAVSFNPNYSFKGKKVVLTGNPIRQEIISLQPRRLQRKLLPTILVTGGNQGSHILNLAIEEALDNLTKKAFVIHQTGDSKFRDFERMEVRKTDRYSVYKWIPNMAEILSKVDLVVGRAGINTLSELAYLRIPTLVIPVPYLYADEQNKNANFFEKLGLVRILPQSKLSGTTLFDEIKDMLKMLRRLNEKAKESGEVIIPDAAKRLAVQTILLAKS